MRRAAAAAVRVRRNRRRSYNGKFEHTFLLPHTINNLASLDASRNTIKLTEWESRRDGDNKDITGRRSSRALLSFRREWKSLMLFLHNNNLRFNSRDNEQVEKKQHSLFWAYKMKIPKSNQNPRHSMFLWKKNHKLYWLNCVKRDSGSLLMIVNLIRVKSFYPNNISNTNTLSCRENEQI